MYAIRSYYAEYGELLGHHILTAQKARHLSLELTGHLPYIQQGPVSKLLSVDSIEASFKVILQKNNNVETIRITSYNVCYTKLLRFGRPGAYLSPQG